MSSSSIDIGPSAEGVEQVSTPDLTAATTGSPALVWLFGLWAFLASVLVFWVELMVAKMLLPQFGGSPSVWNTALVFFQVNLLAGYAAAHFLSRLSSRSHKVVQSLLMALPLLTLPVAIPAFLTGGTSLGPTAAVLISLVLMLGAPFFALTTSAPTLQHWFAQSGHPRAGDPYFLYASSNLGSVVGLFGYPLALERISTITDQTVWWTMSYAGVVVLTVLAARSIPSWRRDPSQRAKSIPLSRRFRWASVAFVPSLALLGVTRHLSTDVAAFPLMWTIPLAIYLGSFTVTFGERGHWWHSTGETLLRPLVVLAALGFFVPLPLWLGVAIPMAFLGALSLAAHGRVYEDRPEAGSVTVFYLWVSIGGAIGGLFGALAAPALFEFIVEYPLAVVLAGLLVARPMFRFSRNRLMGLLALTLVLGSLLFSGAVAAAVVAFAALLAHLFLERRWLALTLSAFAVLTFVLPSPGVEAAERTFFGVYRVHQGDGFRYIMSGSTLHGVQVLENGKPIAASYYNETGPIGEVFDQLHPGERDIGVVGLGIGNLSVYAREADRMVFYEIDPAVEKLAREHFEMFDSAIGDLDVVIGDGRLEIERRAPSHDLLVVDAFTSDAIPVHLITLDAFESYLSSLSDRGVLLVHVSNRHLELEPIVGRIAQELDLQALVNRYVAGPEDGEWATDAIWVMIDPTDSLSLSDEWEPARVGDVLWTDSFSDVVSVIRWR